MKENGSPPRFHSQVVDREVNTTMGMAISPVYVLLFLLHDETRSDVR
jgi:hypothetical protein